MMRRIGVVLKVSNPEAIELGRQLLVELERLGYPTIWLRGGCASSVTPKRGCTRITCAFFGFSGSTPGTAIRRAGWMPTRWQKSARIRPG